VPFGGTLIGMSDQSTEGTPPAPDTTTGETPDEGGNASETPGAQSFAAKEQAHRDDAERLAAESEQA
jgi:hypothetical protein